MGSESWLFWTHSVCISDSFCQGYLHLHNWRDPSAALIGITCTLGHTHWWESNALLQIDDCCIEREESHPSLLQRDQDTQNSHFFLKYVWPTLAKPDPWTQGEGLVSYIWICHLGIYLAFMNIFIHTANSWALAQTTGSDAVVIAYSAIRLDLTHGCSGTNPCIGLTSDPPLYAHMWGSGFARLSMTSGECSSSVQYYRIWNRVRGWC